MNTVTKEDFLTWLRSQPDDREVAMDENESKDSCGCVMVQYGIEHDIFAKDSEGYNGCGFDCWASSNEDYQFERTIIGMRSKATYVWDFFPDYSWNDLIKCKTFGELKAFLPKE